MKNYIGIWMILFVSFVLFAALSFYDTIDVGGQELKTSDILSVLTEKPDEVVATEIETANELATSVETKIEVDTASQTILFIGDSMLEGLSPRLAAYAKHNGHKLYTVIWYSSTSEIWGETTKLAEYIKKYKPTYVFICLGANELFVRDISSKRDKYVKNIISQIGSLPYVWIGPPNWKEDTGINDLIATNVAQGTFFLSNGMHFDRASDGAHPTRSSAILWMDSVARWMPNHSAHPILMEMPEERTARATRIEVLQPKR